MGVAQFRIDQATLGAGTPGVSRKDGVVGQTVTLTFTGTSTTSVEFRFVSSTETPTPTLSNPSGPATFTPNPSDGYGTYLIECIVDAGVPGQEDVSRRIFAIPAPTTGLRLPAPNERADPTAADFNSGTAIVEASNDNVGGNIFGWARDLNDWLKEVQNLAVGGGGETNTASNLGSGEGVFASKSGVDLEFKSLVGGTGISLSSTATEITIDRDAVSLDDLSDVDLTGAVQGSILYRNATEWVVLPPGTSGQFLETQGPSADPQWADVSGSVSLQNAYDVGRSITTTSPNPVAINVPTPASDNALDISGQVRLIGPADSTIVGDVTGVTTSQTLFGNNLDGASQGFTYLFGTGLTVVGAANILIGNNITANADDSVAIGVGIANVDNNVVAIGRSVSANVQDATAVGHQATAAGTGAVAIGRLSVSGAAGASNTVAIGRQAEASGTGGAIAIGSTAEAAGNSSIAIGSTTVANTTGNDSALAIGNSAAAQGQRATAVGRLTDASGSNSFAAGDAAVASGTQSVSIGNGATATATRGIAIGFDADAQNLDAIALGRDSVGGGDEATAVGTRAEATGSRSSALGFVAIASGSNGVAIGNQASASGAAAIALNGNASVNGAISIGGGSEATDLRSIAIGQNARTTKANQAVIGGFDVGITELAIGYSAESSTPQSDVLLTATSGEATSGASGTNLQLRGGLGDGAGTDGYVELLSAVQANGGVGSSGQVLTSRGAGLSPEWTTVSGGGGEANTASNLGTGEGVFASKTGVDLEFKSLVAGTNVTLSSTATEITIDASGSGAGTLQDAYDNGNTITLTAGTPVEITAASATDAAIDIQTGILEMPTAIGIGSTLTLGSGSNVVALGTEATADANQAVGIGWRVDAGGTNSVAIGREATVDAGTDRATVVGANSTAFTDDSVVIGQNNTGGQSGGTLGVRVVAIGSSASVTQNTAIGIGASVTSDGTDAVAIGTGASAESNSAIAIGDGASVPTGSANAIAVGINASGTANGTVAVGAGAQATATESIALGASSVTGGSALGAVDADVSGSQSICIGNATTDSGSDFGVVLGSAAQIIDGTDGIAIGRNTRIGDATNTGANSIAMGVGATVLSNNGYAIGSNAEVSASSPDAIAIGRGASATGANAFALGHDTTADGTNALAISPDSNATGVRAIALGGSATADNAITIGDAANAAENTIVLGQVTAAPTSTDVNAVLIGTAINFTAADAAVIIGNATAGASRAVSIGRQADADSTGNVAVGNEAFASGANSVAVGLSADSLQSGVAIGASAANTGTFSTAVGTSAIANTNGVAIGESADAAVGGIALGRGATATANRCMIGGQAGGGILQLYLGRGETDSAPAAEVAFRATSASATSGANGSTIQIIPGAGDGAGNDGVTEILLADGTTNGLTVNADGAIGVGSGPVDFGTSGQVLTSRGPGLSAEWTTVSGGGGEANTASNLGTGEGVFASKTGVDLEFRSLDAGSGLGISGGPNSISYFLSADLGDLNDVDTTGQAQGAVLYRDASEWVVLPPGTSGQFLQTQGAGANPVWATVSGGSGEANTASNLGAGEGVFASKAGVDLEFKSLTSGVGLSTTSTSTEVEYSLDAQLADLSNVALPTPTALPVGSYQSTSQSASSNLEVADSAALQVNQSYAVSFWMRPSAQQNQIPLVGKGINSSGEEGWNVGMHFSQGTNGTFWVEIESTSGGMGSSTYFDVTAQADQFRANEWTHHVVVVDYSVSPPTCVIYSDGGAGVSATGKTVNGSLVGAASAASSRTDNTQPFRIGGGSGFYSGFSYSNTLNMADVTVWDGTLTAADAEALYNLGGLVEPTAISGLSASPLYYYPIRDATTLTDQTGSAAALTAQGTMAPSTLAPSGLSEGTILYKGASDWEPLAPGTAGQVLETQGSGAAPQWIDAPGETNTASNLGFGSDVFAQKTGADLEFRSLVGGTNITLSQSATEITIDNDITTLTSLDDVSGTAPVAGDILYRGVSGTWVKLNAGASGTSVLWTNGVGLPVWTGTPTVDSISFPSGVQVGTGASDGGNNSSVAVGRNAITSNVNSVAVGHDSSVSSTSGDAVVIGEGAEATEFRTVAIGRDVSADHPGAIVIGAGSVSERANQCILGGPGNATIEELVVGSQPSASFAPPTDVLITTISGEGTTNQDGSNLQLRGGLGAGTGDDGYIELLSALRADGSVGASSQVLVSNGAGAAPSWVDLTSDYAGCYAVSNSTATTVSATGTFFTISGMANTTPSNVSSSGSSATLTAGATGTYKIDWHVYISGGLAGELDVGVLQNTSLVAGGLSQGQNDPDTDSQQQAGSVIVDATASDVFELALRSSLATGSTTVVSGTFTLIRIA